MDTSLTVRNMRRQSWALMLREQSASGLSVKDWCEQNNLSTKSFYYRHRQVQSMLLDSAEESRFTELVMPEPSVPNPDLKPNASAGMAFTPQLMISAGVSVRRNQPFRDQPNQPIQIMC